MKVIIAGSRTFNNYGYFKEKMLEVQKQMNIDEMAEFIQKELFLFCKNKKCINSCVECTKNFLYERVKNDSIK